MSTRDRVSEIANDCVMSRMRLLNRAITKRYDDALRGLGLTASQLNILVLVSEMQVARTSDIASWMDADLSTLTRNLGRMVKRGWLERVASEDARSQPYVLREEGKALLRAAYVPWKAVQKEVLEDFGEDFRREIFAAASRLAS